MSTSPNDKLERWVDRQLTALPDLLAPGGLAAKVMQRLAHAEELPARSAWYTWARPVQAAAFIALSLFFAALCWGGWWLVQTESFALVASAIVNFGSAIVVTYTALATVVETFWSGMKELGWGLILALIVAGSFVYAMCLGLGAFYLRMALDHSLSNLERCSFTYRKL
ncbi:MAG TPA: hypothetical protein VN673_08855 [Clostridia bacterium]|nr:hypothetical protein [Clostridia bacterium]